MGALLFNSLLFERMTALSVREPLQDLTVWKSSHQEVRCLSSPAAFVRAFPQFGFGQMCLRLRAWTSYSVMSETLTALWMCIVFVLGTEIIIEAFSRETLEMEDSLFQRPNYINVSWRAPPQGGRGVIVWSFKVRYIVHHSFSYLANWTPSSKSLCIRIFYECNTLFSSTWPFLEYI